MSRGFSRRVLVESELTPLCIGFCGTELLAMSSALLGVIIPACFIKAGIAGWAEAWAAAGTIAGELIVVITMLVPTVAVREVADLCFLVSLDMALELTSHDVLSAPSAPSIAARDNVQITAGAIGCGMTTAGALVWIGNHAHESSFRLCLHSTYPLIY
jgi:hypothetical protein